MATKLKVECRADGWWITNVPPGVEEMGPYTTKKEANDDRRGVERCLREDDVTHDKTGVAAKVPTNRTRAKARKGEGDGASQE